MLHCWRVASLVAFVMPIVVVWHLRKWEIPANNTSTLKTSQVCPGLQSFVMQDNQGSSELPDGQQPVYSTNFLSMSTTQSALQSPLAKGARPLQLVGQIESAAHARVLLLSHCDRGRDCERLRCFMQEDLLRTRRTAGAWARENFLRSLESTAKGRQTNM